MVSRGSLSQEQRAADIYRKQSLLILAAIPFALMLWNNHGKPYVQAVLSDITLSEQDYATRCDIIHQNALPSQKCDTYEKESLYFHG